MTQNIKLVVSYDGSDFYGFQRQPDSPTIQGLLENVISHTLGDSSPVTGASRTDAGVHAVGQTVNFFASESVPVEKIPSILNRALPVSVRVQSAEKVSSQFNARWSALSKTYHYDFAIGKISSPFWGRFAHELPVTLQIEKMKEAAALFVGEQDFLSFSANNGEEKGNCQRNVTEAQIVSLTERGQHWFRFQVTANGFLYKMVRMMMGTLIEVGLSRLTAGEISEQLRNPQESKTFRLVAPAHGLFLEQVRYAGVTQ